MRHLDCLMRDLGLDWIKVKALDCPSVKVGMQEVQRRTEETALEPAECTRYRSGVMGIAYLSLDRPDLAHAVKCLSRHMQKPTHSNLADLKKTELTRQGHSYSGHGLCGRPGGEKEHYGSGKIPRLTLRQNPKQLAIHSQLVLR
eukprot:4540330-Amphidinium_carterae.1